MLINANLAKLSAKDTVVLANNRQVLAFKKTFATQHGNTQLPKVLSWEQYLRHTWRQISPNSNLRFINQIESRHLIKQSMQKLGQSTDQRLLDEVVKNNDYCANHLIDLSELTRSKIRSSELFSTWINAYKNTKLTLGLIDLHDLPNLIIEADTLITKPHIYGFKTLTPQQQLLFDTIGYQQISAINSHHISALTFDTTTSEIFKAAKWAKAHFDNNSDKSVVIVSPQLNNIQHQLSSIFDQVFDDLLTEIGQKSYNISLGLRLNQYPLIQDLLSILTLSTQLQYNKIQSTLFNQVATCVYVSGYQQERSARNLLMNQVLALSADEFGLDKIDKALSKCPILKAIIDNIKCEKSTNNTLESHLLAFNSTLKTWGFATDRNLSSTEYQLFNKYLQTSLGLNRLSLYDAKVSVQSAITQLNNLTTQVIFQAQASKTNIQILGALEAQGLYFDEAWVLGMTNQFLPAQLNSPRFIATDISTKHQIPHTDYELIATDAKNTLESLSSLADKVVFSYALTHLESKQLPSPLVAFDPTINTNHIQKISPIALESIDDTRTTHLEKLKIKSGVRILKDQMACAFKGFAHRLNTPSFDVPHIGMNRLEQGNIVHNILQYIYQEITSKEQLLALSAKELDSLILNKINAALRRYPNSGFKKIEKLRLSHLVHTFIEADKLREDFCVLATEQNITANIANLEFETRLDRLDQMSNGDKIIFDYKTGTTSIASWCGNAISEPQLPIYTLTNNVQGAAFIELASNKINFKGLSKDPDALPEQSKYKGKCQNWDEQLKIWQQTLNTASLDFQNGIATVLPNKNACDYCEFDLCCRVEK
jgi:probable DNA repair protein